MSQPSSPSLPATQTAGPTSKAFRAYCRSVRPSPVQPERAIASRRTAGSFAICGFFQAPVGRLPLPLPVRSPLCDLPRDPVPRRADSSRTTSPSSSHSESQPHLPSSHSTDNLGNTQTSHRTYYPTFPHEAGIEHSPPARVRAGLDVSRCSALDLVAPSAYSHPHSVLVLPHSQPYHKDHKRLLV